MIYCRKKKNDREKGAKQDQPTGGEIGDGVVWRVHKCVQKICNLPKYSYLCAELKSKQIWKNYQSEKTVTTLQRI